MSGPASQGEVAQGEVAPETPLRAARAPEIVAAALAVPGVAGLHSGRFGEVSTYLPGERITGVVLTAMSGEVHIVADLTRNVRVVGEEVRALAEMIAGCPIVVTVEDVVVPS